MPPAGPSTMANQHHNNVPSKDMMNKTVNFQKEKMNFSLVENRNIPAAK